MKQYEQSSSLECLRRLATDFQALSALRSGELPELELVAVKIAKPRSRPADRQLFAEMRQILDDPAKQGWVRFRSDIRWTGTPNDMEFEHSGPPTHAEWVDGASKSYLLRLDPSHPGSALIWSYEERVLSDDDQLDTDEQPFLREHCAVLGNLRRISGRRLLYNVFWGSDDFSNPHAVRRQLSRFVGFSNEECQ